MDNYIVSIYRREKDNPRLLVGLPAGPAPEPARQLVLAGVQQAEVRELARQLVLAGVQQAQVRELARQRAEVRAGAGGAAAVLRRGSAGRPASTTTR